MSAALEKLFNLMIVVCVKKNARAVRVTERPLEFLLEYETETQKEDLQLPPSLAWPLKQFVAKATGATVSTPVELTVELGEPDARTRHTFRVTLYDRGDLFRLDRLDLPDPFRSPSGPSGPNAPSN